MTIRARLKTAVQHVWQYRDHLSVPTWVAACTVINAQGELYLVRQSGKQRIERTDWLLQDLDGEPTWSSDRDFQRQYEMVAA